MSRGKYGSAGEREPFLLTIRLHALTYFPTCPDILLIGMFRPALTSGKANKRNKGETRATFRSALMSERVFCGCAFADMPTNSKSCKMADLINCPPRLVGGAQPRASEWLRNICNNAYHCLPAAARRCYYF